MLERFGKTTRWLHWTFVGSFLTLAATGALLLVREALGVSADSVTRLVWIHKGAVVGLVVLPAVVWLSGQTGKTWADLRHAVRWSCDDLRWLARQPRAVFGRAELPRAGKLNAGQKLNAVLTGLLTAGLLASGMVLWREPGAFGAWVVHLGLFAAWLPLFGGHLFLALVNPGTRPALRGMVTGRVEVAWAAHHHEAWVRSLASEPGAHRAVGARVPVVAVVAPVPARRAELVEEEAEGKRLDPAVGLADGRG